MPRRGRRMGSDATALEESSETRSSDVAKLMPERSTVSTSGKTAATVSPTESAIATVAYQLWLDNGCPVGSDSDCQTHGQILTNRSPLAQHEVAAPGGRMVHQNPPHGLVSQREEVAAIPCPEGGHLSPVQENVQRRMAEPYRAHEQRAIYAKAPFHPGT